MRTTSKIYGPRDTSVFNSSTSSSEVDLTSIIGSVLKSIGFTGIGIEKSKIGRIALALAGDIIEGVIKEYPDAPEGAVVEIISTSLDKVNFRDKINKLIESMIDVQQESYREMSGGKIMDKWVKQLEAEAETGSDMEQEEADILEPEDPVAQEEPVVEETMVYEPVVEPTESEPVKEPVAAPQESLEDQEAVEHVVKPVKPLIEEEPEELDEDDFQDEELEEQDVEEVSTETTLDNVSDQNLFN